MTTNNSQNGHRWLYSNTAGYILNGLLFQPAINPFSLPDACSPQICERPVLLVYCFPGCAAFQHWIIQDLPEAARRKIGPSSGRDRFVRFSRCCFFDVGILCEELFFSGGKRTV